MNLAREHQFCFNCLQSGHFAPQCTSKHNCQECRKPHHTLLHSLFECDGVAKRADRDTKQSVPAKTGESPAS